MKLNRMMTMCAMVATLALSVGAAFAQDNGGNNGDQQNGGQRRFRNAGGQGGGQGGQGGQGGGQNGGGRNFDPAQMQQRMLERTQEQLGFTNDVEWDAVKPLVQKVMDARRDVGFGGMGRMMGGGRGGQGGQGGQQRGGGMFGQTSPEQEALQKALDDNAPASQIKDLLTKYKTSQKSKQAKLEAAQDDLKKVLNGKQEAEAFLMGLVR